MDALPGDLVLAIAEQLDVKSALKLAGTCKVRTITEAQVLHSLALE